MTTKKLDGVGPRGKDGKHRYEVVREIGAGAMGTVHEGWDRELERLVAIKVLPSGRHDDTTRARFLREAKLLARVQHVNVVAVYDVGSSDEGDPFIVMELLSGQNVREHVESKGGKMAPLEAAALGRDVARGLHAIHASSLVHRDVKPANIFLSKDVVKVLDLGVARAVDESTMSRPGSIVGTTLYISPEQIRAEKIDHRADLYALGATLFELVTGRPPFMGPTAVETVHAHLYDPVPTPPPSVPAGLAAVMTKCLQKKPDARYADAKALEAALEAVLAPQPAAQVVSVIVPPLLDDVPVSSTPATARPPVSNTMRDARPADASFPDLEIDPPAPAPESLPQPESDRLDPVAPLDLAVETGGAPIVQEPHVLEADDEKPADLELDAIVIPPATPPTTPLRPVGSSYAMAPLPEAQPSPIAGFFAVLPASVHARVALGATVLAIVVAVLGSWLFFLLFAFVAAYGLVGYFVRRRMDGEE